MVHTHIDNINYSLSLPVTEVEIQYTEINCAPVGNKTKLFHFVATFAHQDLCFVIHDLIHMTRGGCKHFYDVQHSL